jgi:hypothetical protein
MQTQLARTTALHTTTVKLPATWQLPVQPIARNLEVAQPSPGTVCKLGPFPGKGGKRADPRPYGRLPVLSHFGQVRGWGVEQVNSGPVHPALCPQRTATLRGAAARGRLG